MVKGLIAFIYNKFLIHCRVRLDWFVTTPKKCYFSLLLKIFTKNGLQNYSEQLDTGTSTINFRLKKEI